MQLYYLYEGEGVTLRLNLVRFLRKNLLKSTFLFTFIEFFICVIAFFLSHNIFEHASFFVTLINATLFGLVVMIGNLSLGAQLNFKHRLSEYILRCSISVIITIVGMSLIYFLSPELNVGRKILFVSAIFALIGMTTVRFSLIKLLGRNKFYRRVLVLGAGERALMLSDTLKSDQTDFINIVGFIPFASDVHVRVHNDSLIEMPENFDFLKLCKRFDVDEIVYAVDERRKAFPMQALMNCKLAGIPVVNALEFFERDTKKIEIDMLYPSWLVFSDGFERSQITVILQRFFDILCSFIILCFSFPLTLTACILIKIEDGWSAPLLYSQIRVGLNGKPIKVFKLRSMSIDAESGKGAQWAQKNDPRVTKVGAFIRKYRIDELPQIFSIFKGDMSLVGPRPERPEFVGKLSDQIPYYGERHTIKPGLAGWAQLNYPYGATVDDAKMKLKYDLYYAKNNSVLLYFLTLIQTVEVVVFGKGQ